MSKSWRFHAKNVIFKQFWCQIESNIRAPV